VELENRISPEKLRAGCPDKFFYSLLVQAGYLSLEKMERMTGVVAIPNVELSEVWRRFLLAEFTEQGESPTSLFDNIDTPALLAQDLESFLTRALLRLSFYDLPEQIGADGRLRTPERHYQLLLYGIFYMGEELFHYSRLFSNRESGDGRYDIMMELDDRVLVFELKSATAAENLEELAQEALDQIGNLRYGADTGKPVLGVGCAFRKKLCRVTCG
jgi:hypothetical protein